MVPKLSHPESYNGTMNKEAEIGPFVFEEDPCLCVASTHEVDEMSAEPFVGAKGTGIKVPYFTPWSSIERNEDWWVGRDSNPGPMP